MRLPLQFSTLECLLRSVIYGAAIVAPWFSSLPLSARVSLSLLLALYAGHGLSSLMPGRRVRALVFDGRGCRLSVGATTINACELRILCSSEWLVLLTCRAHAARPVKRNVPGLADRASRRVNARRRTRLIWILPDSLTPAQHSALRRRIRLGIDAG